MLNAVSLQVPEGQVACIVGPSGCGKSTILRLVAGLDVPDAGRIMLAGTELSGPGWALEARKRRLNMVFQDYALWPHMRVTQIVGYGLAHLTRVERDARVAALLDQMQIAALADRLPSQVSGGQQQRVAIAGRWPPTPTCCCWTSPCPILTCNCGSTCGWNSPICLPALARPCFMSPMTRWRLVPLPTFWW
ncbi:ABC transporter ATP-binding protein [Pseudotabrizicola sediminis]|uniref:ABC transporter ATP-binding protein n=1 Tax=Pseudotabrizicola sediminis TaxID=2486418 RepID=UPI001FDA065D|nr:ABC transporter ATP-binding protein [Pseudotabrizicola sediminis]